MTRKEAFRIAEYLARHGFCVELGKPGPWTVRILTWEMRPAQYTVLDMTDACEIVQRER